MASIRQDKFARQLQRDLGEIFQRNTQTLFEGKMVMVNDVEVSPDLGYAKVYLGFLETNMRPYLMDLVEYHGKEIRHELAGRIRNQVRKVPELHFFADETMDHALKMDKLFDQLNQKDQKKEE
jgi:ribosome-binding factor A